MTDMNRLGGTRQLAARSTAAPRAPWVTTLSRWCGVVPQMRAALESLRSWLPGRWVLVCLAVWSLIVAPLSAVMTIALLGRFALGASLLIWAGNGLLILTLTLLFLASGSLILLTAPDLAWGVRSWCAPTKHCSMLARRSQRGRSAGYRHRWNRFRQLQCDESSSRALARAAQPCPSLANHANGKECS